MYWNKPLDCGTSLQSYNFRTNREPCTLLPFSLGAFARLMCNASGRVSLFNINFIFAAIYAYTTYAFASTGLATLEFSCTLEATWPNVYPIKLDWHIEQVISCTTSLLLFLLLCDAMKTKSSIYYLLAIIYLNASFTISPRLSFFNVLCLLV